MKQFVEQFLNQYLVRSFVILYAGGLLLYFIPATRPVLIFMTPLTLLLVNGSVFYHHKQWTVKVVGVFAFIYMGSMLAEMIGVATSWPFGTYQYGDGLGYKIKGVPYLIGLNWVFLTYASHDIMSRISNNKFVIVSGGALLMVIYDLILEKAAPLMDMWVFKDNNPPLANYITWFALAFLFHVVLALAKVKTENKPARWLLFSQMGFFLILIAYSILIG